MEYAAEKGHEGDGPGDFYGYENQADSAELQDVAEKKPRPEQDDSSFEPEFIRGHAGPKKLRHSYRVGDGQPKDDSPEDVFDIRKRPVMGLGERADILLEQFSRVTDRSKQEHSGNHSQEFQRRLHRLDLGNRDYVSHFSFSPFSQDSLPRD